MTTSAAPHRIRWGRLAAIWGVLSALGVLQSYGTFVVRNEWPRMWPFAALQLAVWLPWIPLTPLVLALGRRWPLPGGAGVGTTGALARHAGAALAITTAQSLALVAASFAMQARLDPGSLDRYPVAGLYVAGLLARLAGGLVVYAAVVAVGATLDSRRRLRDEALRSAHLAAQLASAQLGALKMQLQPHFLFNTLHAVTVLIREDPPAAARTVTRLGDLLRLTLARAGETEVTLERELEFVRAYLEIERTRFADRLRVDYDIAPEARGAFVPDFLLQPLVENAIRHGVAPHAAAGRLLVRAYTRPLAPGGDARRLVLEVQDDGAGGCAESGGGEGIGLATTRARLAALYRADDGAGPARCELVAAAGGGCVARVTLPFRPAGEGARA